MAGNILLADARRQRSFDAPGYRAATQTGAWMLGIDSALVVAVMGAWLLSPWGAWMLGDEGPAMILPAYMAFPGAKLACGLYPGHGLVRSMRLRQALLALCGACAALLSAIAALDLMGQWINTAWFSLILPTVVIVLCLLASDPVVRRRMLRSGRWQEPVFVFGSSEAGAEVVRQLNLDPHLGYRPMCLVDDSAIYVPEEEQGVPVLRSRELSRHGSSLEASSTAIVIERTVERSTLLRLYTSGVFERVLLVPDCHDLISLRSRVRTLGGMLTLEVRSDKPRPLAALGKRISDVVMSGAALLLLSPILALIWLLVRLDSPGPVLFTQPRWAGEDRRFTAMKFRSMHLDGDRRLERHFLTHPAARRDWEIYHKLDHDPRVTRVGRWLRASSLDELPQLINVLRGDMSIVGPRPYTLDELRKLGPAREILGLVRPGITGYWQVSGRNRRTFRERIAMDCYYVRNLSISLDLWVIYRTVISVVTADGK